MATGDISQRLRGQLICLSTDETPQREDSYWFSLSKDDFLLKYYKNAEDLFPQGVIDIRCLTSFIVQPVVDESSSEKPIKFSIEIISDQKKCLINVNNVDASLAWYTTLQSVRKAAIESENVACIKLPERQPEPEIREDEPSNLPKSQSSVFYDSEAYLKKQRSKANTASDSSVTQKISPKSRKKSMTNLLRSMKILNRGCENCKEYETKVISLVDDIDGYDAELQASHDVIKVLQEQLLAFVSEKESLHEICKSENVPEKTLDSLSRNEREIASQRLRIIHLEGQVNKLDTENDKLKSDNNQLKEKISLLEELVQVKDQTVIALTNEIFDLETEKVKRVEPKSSLTLEPEEIEICRDTIDAYKVQNKCLTREILELNNIISIMQKRRQQLQSKCYEWEAKTCQIQSKLLSLIKELKQSMETYDKYRQSEDKNLEGLVLVANESVRSMVSRLLEEGSIDIPLSWKDGNRKRTDTGSSETSREYDELGFINTYPDALEVTEALELKAINLQTKTAELNDPEMVKSQAMWKQRWDTFVVSLSSGETVNSDLKDLLRSGVPQEYRCKVWQNLINSRIRSLKNRLGKNYYQNLISKTKSTNSLLPATKQIELDLLRTLPNNRHFETAESVGIGRLRRVLTVYAQHNPTVGYCQGMNRLAAVAILIMPEEDAFWCLLTIVEKIMPPDYYSSTLIGAHVDQYVLRDLMADKLPRLNQHLEKLGIELSLFSWFLTIFVDSIPVKIYLRIWDVFLSEGTKVLFRFALAFLKYHQETLLSIEDSTTINLYLRTLGEKTLDVKLLCDIAFNVLNPFPMHKVRTKRTYYRDKVATELKRFDEMRKSMPVRDSSHYDSLSE